MCEAVASRHPSLKDLRGIYEFPTLSRGKLQKYKGLSFKTDK
jgi:hypothetical protein